MWILNFLPKVYRKKAKERSYVQDLVGITQNPTWSARVCPHPSWPYNSLCLVVNVLIYQAADISLLPQNLKFLPLALSRTTQLWPRCRHAAPQGLQHSWTLKVKVTARADSRQQHFVTRAYCPHEPQPSHLEVINGASVQIEAAQKPAEDTFCLFTSSSPWPSQLCLVITYCRTTRRIYTTFLCQEVWCLDIK